MLSGAPEVAFACPEWLNPDLVEHLDLPARWRAVHASSDALRDCTHPRAHRILTSFYFTSLLEGYDPGVMRIPIEARHPFLDLRVVEYLMSVPASPWCVDKNLLRMAMHGRLPESIRLRPKTPLPVNAVYERLQQTDARWVDAFEAAPALGKYVDRTAVPQIAGTGNPDRTWTDLRPLCLNLWLQQMAASGRVSRREEHYEAV
jgi:asparagine synthase (glutamine-hydrolysing)